MDLSVIYGKTAKGLRARTSLIGGLSSHLMKVLTHIDGTSEAETILLKYGQLTEQTLIAALVQLENDGYIRPVTIARPKKEEDWSPATIFNPMVVEEILSEEEAEAKAAEEARLAEYKAKIIEETRLQAERKAREKEEQAQQEAREKEKEKEKARAEAKVKAQLEAERIAREAEAAQKKAEAEARAKAEEEARLEAERKAKAEEEARQKAELEAQAAAQARLQAEEKLGAERKAREEIEKKLEAERKAREDADQARAKAEEARLQAELKAQQATEEASAKAEAEAKENARREIERIAREAEEAQKKAETEAHAKAEKEQLEAERKALAEEKAKLETERKAKAEEDAREKAEQARIEADRKEKAKEEKRRADAEAKEKAEQARIEAENKAKAEEEKRRAKAEAEEKTKVEEKERARLEIARIVREAEEARKRSEAQAKEERQEAKRKNKAEQDARLTAERKAKEDAEQIRAEAAAEEKAKAEAVANASLAMEHFAIDVEEEKKKSELEVDTKFENTRVKAQRKTKLAAEKLQAKLEAEEKVKVEVNEAARLEMERISREADELRKKHKAEVPVVDSANAIEVRWAADSEMDDDDLDDEEEVIEDEEYYAEEEYKVQREIDKKVKQEAEVQGREEIKRTAREEAEVKSKAHARKFVTIQNYGKWFSKVGKTLLIYLPLIALLMIAVLHFINITPLVKPIEKLASEGVGEPVKIDEVRASLWPQPHLVLGNITIGANTSLKIEAVNVIPDTSTLLEEVKTVKSIEIEGLKVDKDNLGQPQQWISHLGKATHLKVEQIDLKNISLKIRDLELGPFDGKVGLTESKELKNISLNTADHTLSVQVTPQGSNYDVVLTGEDWALPVNSKIVFDDVKATGILNPTGVDFSNIEGSIYGGSINAKAVVDWSNQWLVAGNFDLARANLPLLLKAFSSSASIDGKLDLTGIFSCKSDIAAKLTDSPDIAASFEARDGKVNGVDLVRAVMFRNNQSLTGDSTYFDKLTGSLQLNDGHYQYRKLALETSQFHAKGNLDIQPNQDISGMINADLVAESRRLYTNFGLAGKVNAVKRQ